MLDPRVFATAGGAAAGIALLSMITESLEPTCPDQEIGYSTLDMSSRIGSGPRGSTPLSPRLPTGPQRTSSPQFTPSPERKACRSSSSYPCTTGGSSRRPTRGTASTCRGRETPSCTCRRTRGATTNARWPSRGGIMMAPWRGSGGCIRLFSTSPPATSIWCPTLWRWRPGRDTGSRWSTPGAARCTTRGVGSWTWRWRSRPPLPKPSSSLACTACMRDTPTRATSTSQPEAGCALRSKKW
mmetsp:Transcript_23109/g.72094  ORF Transcript_23109/g.72094 Transcript_23109/m.72094 type:complete len:241 (+) Transcript_23109:1166-1888(+)